MLSKLISNGTLLVTRQGISGSLSRCRESQKNPVRWSSMSFLEGDRRKEFLGDRSPGPKKTPGENRRTLHTSSLDRLPSNEGKRSTHELEEPTPSRSMFNMQEAHRGWGFDSSVREDLLRDENCRRKQYFAYPSQDPVRELAGTSEKYNLKRMSRSFEEAERKSERMKPKTVRFKNKLDFLRRGEKLKKRTRPANKLQALDFLRQQGLDLKRKEKGGDKKGIQTEDGDVGKVPEEYKPSMTVLQALMKARQEAAKAEEERLKAKKESLEVKIRDSVAKKAPKDIIARLELKTPKETPLKILSKRADKMAARFQKNAYSTASTYTLLQALQAKQTAKEKLPLPPSRVNAVAPQVAKPVKGPEVQTFPRFDPYKVKRETFMTSKSKTAPVTSTTSVTEPVNPPKKGVISKLAEMFHRLT